MREQKTSQIFSATYTHIYFTGYIKHAKWWIINGKDWWSSNQTFGCDVLYYLLEGELEFTIEGHVYRLRSGQVIYIPAGTPHHRRICSDGPIRKFYTHFDLRFGKDSLSAFFKIPYVSTISDVKGMTELFHHLKKLDHLENRPVSVLGTNGALLQLLAFMLNDIRAEPTLPELRSEYSLQIAVQYIHSHLHCPITTTKLAELTGYSTGHFTKNFKKLFHCMPQEYINSVKLERAQKRLRETGIPIPVIAEELGFCDASHFGKFFKAHTGITPAVYRRTVIHRV